VKKFILLNGCVGVGKTSVAEKLYDHVDNPVIIHGDDLTKFKHFDVHNPLMKAYGIQLMNMTAQYHLDNDAVDTVIMDYIVENHDELNVMLSNIPNTVNVFCFYLNAPVEIIKARIQGRERPGFEKELLRADEILEEQKAKLFNQEHPFHIIDAFQNELYERAQKIIDITKIPKKT
jgi:thymidylate kinase